ncbi:diguanylate cyclase [Aquincola sp. S2]|uniref:diguanylate cyclase n=1 Tax=Pseudaquabacterium terrae TaxID=2732868 RepID=A0ABX2EJT1_9BURK|nr:diguanylate cyclase [Aquabacterium terrae]NRF68899.1 diguanylate cyclase [Aquabacterium terrae]
MHAPLRSRLLVVDDQPANVQALYQALADEHQILVATNGAQALALARDKLPDLVLLDIVMDGIDGLEVCRRLQADEATRQIPVIFVTGLTSEADEARGLELGAVDFITKPIHPAVVRARVRTHLVLKQQSDLLRQLALVDPLTGVPNRRFFDEHFGAEWRRALREGRSIALIMIDVDAFKPYNDHYGHLAGDHALQRVARGIAAGLARPGDRMARYGGEEFACILPDTDTAGALEVARRLGRAVHDLAIEHPHSPLDGVMTISLGVAAQTPKPGDDPAELLRCADEQLYEAKRSGRGRACAAGIPSDAVPTR